MDKNKLAPCPLDNDRFSEDFHDLVHSLCSDIHDYAIKYANEEISCCLDAIIEVSIHIFYTALLSMDILQVHPPLLKQLVRKFTKTLEKETLKTLAAPATKALLKIHREKAYGMTH